MNWVQEGLGKFRGKLQEDLRIAGADARRQIEVTLATIDQLLAEGKMDEVKLTAGELDDALRRVVASLGDKYERSLLLLSAESIKDDLVGKLRQTLTTKVMELFGGAIPVALLGIVKGLLEDLLRGYRQIDLSRYAREENVDILARVIASAAAVEKQHKELDRRADARRKMDSYYKSIQAGRDKLVAEILGSLLLDGWTKREAFRFQRQHYVLTPGQRNLLVEVLDKFESLPVGPGVADAENAADLFLAVAAGNPKVLRPTTKPDLLNRYAVKLVQGLARRYPQVWESWFPEDYGPDTHLGSSIQDLLGDDAREFTSQLGPS